MGYNVTPRVKPVAGILRTKHAFKPWCLWHQFFSVETDASKSSVGCEVFCLWDIISEHAQTTPGNESCEIQNKGIADESNWEAEGTSD